MGLFTPTPWANTSAVVSGTPFLEKEVSISERVGNVIQQTPITQTQTPYQRQVITPTLNINQAQTYQAQNLSISPVKVNATGIEGYESPTGRELLEKAQRQETISQVSGVGSAILTMYNANSNARLAHKYTKQVIGTAAQYEAQKKIIDTNIAKQESLMTDAYTQNMAQADAMYAGRNVDIRSEALTAVKQQGGIDLGKDITDIREQGELAKASLNLDYAMNVRKAAQAEKAAVQTARNQSNAAAFNMFLNFAF